MPKTKQLTISIDNRPGTLAHVAKVLGDSKVNMLAFYGGTSGAEGYVQVVVDNVNKAKKALGGAGLSYTEQSVLRVEIPDKPGALGAFAGKLAARDINITSSYATTVKGARKASVVLVVSDPDKAARIR